MAKELAMVQRNKIGKEIRKKLIDLEEAYSRDGYVINHKVVKKEFKEYKKQMPLGGIFGL